MAKKVIVTDKLAAEGIKKLKDAGLEVNEAHEMKKEDLPAIMKDYDAIIVRSATQVKGDLLAKATKLKVIGRAGVGLDNVDVETAKKQNIVVVNTPAATTISVAELAFTFVLGLTRDIVTGTNGMRKGQWLKKDMPESTEVYGKTLGILGFGRIGREIAKRALVFGMKVLAYDVMKVPEESGVKLTTFDDVLANSDYITLHMPLTADNKNMISTAQFAKMKKGVKIVDCGRGGVLDLEALYIAMKAGKVAGAGLDVYPIEPLSLGLPPYWPKVFRLPNVLGMPHFGASTEEGQLRAGVQIAELVIQELKKVA